MSKSITARRNSRKEKGKAYKTSTRNNGYTPGPAPHNLPCQREHSVASMLVRNPRTELLGIEVEDWHREGETESIVATMRFACGCMRRKETQIKYAPGERQKLFEGMVGAEMDVTLVGRLENLRRGRWMLKQDLLRDMQRSYGHGLPRHVHEQSEAA